MDCCIRFLIAYLLLYSPLQPGEIQSITPPSPTTRSIQSVVDVPVPASASFKEPSTGQVLSMRVNFSKSNPALEAAALTAGTALAGIMGSLA
jgi:hypothetical protein